MDRELTNSSIRTGINRICTCMRTLTTLSSSMKCFSILFSVFWLKRRKKVFVVGTFGTFGTFNAFPPSRFSRRRAKPIHIHGTSCLEVVSEYTLQQVPVCWRKRSNVSHVQMAKFVCPGRHRFSLGSTPWPYRITCSRRPRPPCLAMFSAWLYYSNRRRAAGSAIIA